MAKTRALTQRRAFRPKLEALEDRTLLSVLEDFSSGTLANYATVTRYYASADVVDLGGANGLHTADGQDWLINDHVRVEPGDTVDGYVYMTQADGRSYFALGTIAPNQVNQPLITGRTLALEMAPNTNQLSLVAQYGYNFRTLTSPPTSLSSTGGTITLGTAPFTYQDGHTYYFAASWGTANDLYAVVLDVDTGDLASVSATIPTSSLFPFNGGGIGFRRIGSDQYWYNLSRYEGGAGGAPANTTGGAVTSPNLYYWDTGDPTIPNPFQYQSTPGTNRDISLAQIDALSQVRIIGDRVGLAARNLSANQAAPGRVQVGWGPNYSGIHGSNDSSNESPGLQWYMYRLRPGEDSQRIGQSDPKRFWNSSQSDYMHLQPGRQDAYQVGHNSTQADFHPEPVINPITAEWYDLSYEATRTNDGTWAFQSRTYDDSIQHLLQTRVDDLDPNNTDVNPPGTRWFLAANIFVAGDQDVSNNSRWLEYRPTRTGGNFTFTQVGTSGVDICTMPGLTPIGRCAAGDTASPLIHTQGVPVRHAPVSVATHTASPLAGAILLAQSSARAATAPVLVAASVPPDAARAEQGLVTLDAVASQDTVSQMNEPQRTVRGDAAVVDTLFALSSVDEQFVL